MGRQLRELCVSSKSIGEAIADCAFSRAHVDAKRSMFPAVNRSASPDSSGLQQAIEALRAWIETRQFAGYEPFDLLNSPYLSGAWARKTLPSLLLIQFGKRFSGLRIRQSLKVPRSRNPKALGLCLSAYCDLARAGYDVSSEASWLKSELIRLRSPHESEYCWGYDWDYLSLRGTRLPAFAPNCIASYSCGTAMMQMNEVFGDSEALEIAESVARFMATRLYRSFESADQVCFSYTPNDKTLIFNSSALAGVFLARLGNLKGDLQNLSLARKAMVFLARGQLRTGGWYYGQRRRQRWIDSFHTSYNVCALLDYQRATGDPTFEAAMLLGHRYYQTTFFTEEGAPRYFHNRTFPIDIHACSQAILHFTAFSSIDPNALESASRTFQWTMRNMAAPDGSFYYQRHRWWTNRTPYMRWGQAWMLRALAMLLLAKASPPPELKRITGLC
jgi:rhamnogalacturonyl hydrolase YesR